MGWIITTTKQEGDKGEQPIPLSLSLLLLLLLFSLSLLLFSPLTSISKYNDAI